MAMLIWTPTVNYRNHRMWCADGDGMLVIIESRAGYRVVDQNAHKYVGCFQSLAHATTAAETHMRDTDPDMWDHLMQDEDEQEEFIVKF